MPQEKPFLLELGYCSIFEFLSRPTSVWQLSTEQPVNALLDVVRPFAANLEQKWFTTTREGDRDASGVGPKKFWQKLPVDQNAKAAWSGDVPYVLLFKQYLCRASL